MIFIFQYGTMTVIKRPQRPGHFTNRDQMRAQAVRDMALQAGQVVVLTESDKFSKHGIVPLNLKEQVKTVITDDQISEASKSELESKGIKVTF